MTDCAGCTGCDFSTNRTKEHLLQHVRIHHPTKIRHDECHLLPQREDFLDKELADAFATQVGQRQPLLFMPNTVSEKKDFIGSYGNKTQHYVLQFFGILPCGSTACVRVTGIEPFFDVKVPSLQSVAEATGALKSRFHLDNIAYIRMETIKLRPQKYFVRHPVPYLRVYFNNLDDRKRGLTSVGKHNEAAKIKFETASDDANYYPKIAREQRFKTADWNRISNYEVLPSGSRCKYNISVDIKDFTKLSAKKRKELISGGTKLSKVIERDNMVVGQWDIETHRQIQNGIPPRPEDTDFTIFTICTNYSFHHTDKTLLTICTTTADTGLRNGIDITIVSDQQDPNLERNMLMAHCEQLGCMMPNQLYAYNGGNFDWPLVKEKLKRNNLLVMLKTKLAHCTTQTTGSYAETESSVLKYCFRAESYKISAEMTHKMECVAQFPGVLDIDVMPMFMKLYPRNEVGLAKSLNFFLQKNGLESKDDMPYKLMFKMYERSVSLLKAPKHCHCSTIGDGITINDCNNNGITNINECKLCTEVVPMLDRKILKDAPDFDDIVYSDELHDDLKGKCCHCGKRERNLRDMADVNHYCHIDCLRPQQLCVKRTLLDDKREVANQAYVSLYDAFYRADGGKVRNLIGKYAFIFGVAFTNSKTSKKEEDKDHYPGAWVFPPIRGIHRRRPITGLDFASLYPSLMMTYSLSPEMTIEDPEEAAELEKEGYTLHKIGPFEFERGAEKGKNTTLMQASGWTVRHNGILNPKKDKNIVTKYEKMVDITVTEGDKVTKKRMRADEEPEFMKQFSKSIKCARRVSYDPIRGREALPGEQMGLLSYVVKKLFDKRVPVKAEFVKWGKLIEQMTAEKRTECTITENGKQNTYAMADVVFYYNKAESKQKAIKLLANTFYGESGNYRSSVYKLLVAAGITTAGQMNIKKVEKFVADKGFVCCYGDTDSLYLSPPDHFFVSLDAKYNSDMSELAKKYDGVLNTPTPSTEQEKAYHRDRVALRVPYWYSMVEITMKVMMELKEQVSDFLLADNGTCFLNMAFEEAGMPTLLCGKKKYAMMAHQETINFYNEELFLRGIDFIKQGQTNLAKNMGMEFLREALSPECEREIYDLAIEHIKKFYDSEHNVSEFVLTGKYKPDKKNVPIHTFVRRMNEMKDMAKNPVEAALYEPPEPGDKFKYVIVARDARYNIRGNKLDIKKGDKMEYLRVYESSQNTDNPLTIDMNYYMKNAIVGLFARFIAYYKDFQPPEGMYDTSDKVQYHQMDVFCIDKASKFLDELCDGVTGYSKERQAEVGKKYKSIYRNTIKSVKSYVGEKYGEISDIIDKYSVKCEDGHVQEVSEFITQIKTACEADSDKLLLLFPPIIPEGPPLMTRKRYNVGELSVLKQRLNYTLQSERVLLSSAFNALRSAIWVIYRYERNIILKIEDQKTQKDDQTAELDDEDLSQIVSFSDEDVAVLNKINEIKLKLTALYYMRKHTKKLEIMLDDKANTVTSEPIRPSVTLTPIVNEPIDDYEWK